jgi:hypothetical protein
MSFLAMILGSFRFPDPAGADAWRTRTIAPDAYGDWPDDPMLFGGEPIAATVAALLDAGAALGGPGDPSFVEAAAAPGDRVTTSGVLVHEDQVTRWHLGLVTALREAGAAGATGQAAILLPALGGATLVSLADGASTIALVPAQQVFADEGLATVAVALDGWINAKQRDPQLDRATYREGEARFWLGAPTADEDAALALARKLDDDALAAALADRLVLAPGLEPLATLVGDAAALRAALDAGTPLARTIAIELCGHAAPERAAPLALALLAHPSHYVVRMAIRALAVAPGAAALDGLLGVLLAHPTEWSSASEALTRAPHPETGARLAALLDDEAAFDPATLAPEARAARTERARRVIEAAGGRRDPAVLEALWRRFEDPRSRWIVPRLVVALARQGGAAVEARGQELQLAMMGMGKALNPDVARRAAILAIDTEDDDGGIIRYDDLDLAGLTALLDEGFLHPQARQNDAPAAGDFFQLMTAWPELRATGYAVSPARPDYRVMIDGVAADLDDVPAERAAALRATLEALAPSASNVELDADHLALWWT